MAVYNEGIFSDEEPIRRTIRDKYRDAFFDSLGGERLKDPFDFDPDPAAQLGVVQGLIDKALSLHMGDTSALQALKSQVSTAALSVPVVGAGMLKRPRLESVRLTSFGDHFNLQNY